MVESQARESEASGSIGRFGGGGEVKFTVENKNTKTYYFFYLSLQEIEN